MPDERTIEAGFEAHHRPVWSYDPRTMHFHDAYFLWLSTGVRRISPALAGPEPDPVAHELWAIHLAIEVAAQSNVRSLLVESGNGWCVRALRGQAEATERAHGELLRQIARDQAAFDRVEFRLVPMCYHAEMVDRRPSSRAGRLRRLDHAERTHHEEILRAQLRGLDVIWEETEFGPLANGRYLVRLDPPRCSCPAWERKWRGVPIPGRRAARLPCKHLAALAARCGIHSPDELLRLARRAS